MGTTAQLYGKYYLKSPAMSEWPSVSLVLVPTDRPRTVSYQPSIVTMSLSCTLFEIRVRVKHDGTANTDGTAIERADGTDNTGVN